MATTFQDVISFLRNNELTSDEHNSLVCLINERIKAKKRNAMRGIEVGDRVTFTDRWGITVKGVVKRRGRGNFHVMEESGKMWRVSATLVALT